MKKLIILLSLCCFQSSFAQLKFDKILYGAAYYYEYEPRERLNEDVRLMKECGINVVRIAESTWAVWEPQDGIFNFSKLDTILQAMDKAGIRVIVGAPTYAIPNWLAREHPEVLATTSLGKNEYGARQNMDIASPVFRFYAERIIRKLVEHVKNYSCVIGYQADNETKSYNTNSDTVNTMFVQYLKNKFKTTDSLNKRFGLNYWSNTVNNWNDFPSMKGNVNASLGCEFAKFQRKLVTEYLAWQVAIIKQYKQADQFITHNFDFDWRNYSYGISPDVDAFAADKAFDITGIDIYHPTAERLTGIEISFCGDFARSLKHNNYLVLETQAQSMSGRQELPFPGQIRLQAFSHLASGANMVEYWPWQSIHNSVETYWNGVLGHDIEPNTTFYEVQKTALELKKTGNHLLNLKIKNKVAILVSNESLTALNWFPFSDNLNYNDIVRQYYDVLYKMNIGCDFVNTSSENLKDYSLLVVPPLYVVSDSFLLKLNEYVKNGGHIIYTFKSGFCDENVQVRTTRMPGILRSACGFSYQQFTNIDKLFLKDNNFNVDSVQNTVNTWAELLMPETCTVLASYKHPYWGKYAAITENNFGKGQVFYIATIPSDGLLNKILQFALENTNIEKTYKQLRFPLIFKTGINQFNKRIYYYFNYSDQKKSFVYSHTMSTNLLTGKKIAPDQTIELNAWDFTVLEEN